EVIKGKFRGEAADAGGHLAVRVVAVVAGEGNLLEVVGTLGAIGSLANLLDRWQQQGDQDANDGNDHQQLDQRGGAPRSPPRPGSKRFHGSDLLRTRVCGTVSGNSQRNGE